MADHSVCTVHTEGDPEDVLFILPPMCREMWKDDEFTYTSPGGVATRYKVKSVDYRIEQVSMEGVGGTETSWRPPEIWYGVEVKS